MNNCKLPSKLSQLSDSFTLSEQSNEQFTFTWEQLACSSVKKINSNFIIMFNIDGYLYVNETKYYPT